MILQSSEEPAALPAAEGEVAVVQKTLDPAEVDLAVEREAPTTC